MSKHAKQQGPFLKLGAFAFAVLLTVSGIAGPQASAAVKTIDLGTAANFAVLGGTGITNTGQTIILGTGSDLGSSPVRAFTGAGSVVTSGTKYLIAAPETDRAQADLKLAYEDARDRPNAVLIAAFDKVTLAPGLYRTAATLSLAADEILTLDAGGDSNAIFIFQIGSALTLAANSKVLLTRGAQAKNVFWQVASSATLAANAEIAGRIMAYTSITAAAGARLNGQLLAMGGSVTLHANNVTNNTNSAASGSASPTPTASPAPTNAPPAANNAPTATATARPSGNALIGSVLVNAVSFSGTPSPDSTYSWQSSPNGTSGWTAIAGATGSTFRLTGDQVGDYVRTVVTAKNAAGTMTRTSPATNQILPPAPARPVLASGSDTGFSNFDGLTSVSRPSLSLAGLVVGTEVVVTATKGNLLETCRFTAQSTFGSCVFPNQLADGTWTLRGNNVLSDVSSDGSGSLFIVIDTTAPAVGAFSADQGSLGTSVLTHSLVFEESVTGLTASDFTLVSTTVTCDSPTLSGFGMSYTVTSANCRGDGAVQLRLKSGAAQDLAGNSGPTSAFMTTQATRSTTTSSGAPAPTTGTEATTGTGSAATSGTGTGTGSAATSGTGFSSTQTDTSVTEDIGISSETVESTANESAAQEAELEEVQSADGLTGSGNQGSGNGGWNWWLIIGLLIGTIFGGAAIFLMRRRLV